MFFLKATAGHGRQDGHRIPVLDRGVQAGQETDVLVVQVHVDEPPQAAVVHQALAQPAVPLLQVDQELSERGSAALDLLGAVGMRTSMAMNNAPVDSCVYALDANPGRSGIIPPRSPAPR